MPGHGSPTPGPSGPQAVRAPGRANKANLACWSFGEGGPLCVKLPAAPLGPQARGGRGSVQSAGLGHVSCAGPARPALPGFKGPCSAELPSRPFWAPRSPAWLWQRGLRGPFPALASPTCPLAVRPPQPAARRERLGAPLLAAGHPPRPRLSWLEPGKKRCHCELSILNI